MILLVLSKDELICIRETDIRVEKNLSVLSHLSLHIECGIQSFIHLSIPHVLSTCNVQGTELGPLGSKHVNLNDIQMVICSKAPIRHFRNEFQVRMCIKQKDCDHSELDTGISCLDSYSHMCNILKWAEVLFLLFLLKSFPQKLVVLCCFPFTSRSNQTTRDIGKIKVVQI